MCSHVRCAVVPSGPSRLRHVSSALEILFLFAGASDILGLLMSLMVYLKEEVVLKRKISLIIQKFLANFFSFCRKICQDSAIRNTIMELVSVLESSKFANFVRSLILENVFLWKTMFDNPCTTLYVGIQWRSQVLTIWKVKLTWKVTFDIDCIPREIPAIKPKCLSWTETRSLTSVIKMINNLYRFCDMVFT